MPDGPSSWRHRERIKVRYQEVDLQNVVFNAHYLAWCDIACSGWMQAAIGWNGVDDAVDWMLVKVEMEWQGSATYGDTIDIDCGVARWGTSSYDVDFLGTVSGEPVFTARITYVCIEPSTKTAIRVPDAMRAALGPADPTRIP